MHLPKVEADIIAIVRDQNFVALLEQVNERYPNDMVVDVSVSVLIKSLKANLELMNTIADKDLLKSLSAVFKRGLLTDLTNLRNHFVSWKNSNYPPLSNYGQITNIKNAIEKLESGEGRLVTLLAGQIDFQSEVTQFLNFKKKTRDADSQLNHIAAGHQKVINISKAIVETQSNVQVLSKEIKTLRDQSEQEKKSITVIHQDSETELKKVAENRQQVETSKENIVAFQQNVDEYRKKIAEMLKEQQEASDTNKADYAKFLKEADSVTSEFMATFKRQTEEIISKNEDYQKRINELLQGANSGRLNETYQKEVTAIQKQLGFWIGGVIVSTILVITVSVVAFYLLKSESFWQVFAERVLLVTPLLLLDGFFILQYNKRQRLLEEYRYRSTVALSLFSFNQLVKQNKEEDILLKFVTGAIDKMFESPFKEDGFSRSQKNMLNTLMSKFGEKAEKGVDGLIETITKK